MKKVNSPVRLLDENGAELRRYLKVRGRFVEIAPGEMLIGRGAECEIKFFNSLVSRHHARIRCRHASVVIEDLGSRNGTRVNGTFLERPHSLRHGDCILIGSDELLFTEAESPPSAALTREQRQSLNDNDDDWSSVTDVAWVGPGDGTNTTGRWPVEMLIELLGRAMLANRDRDVAGLMKQAMAAVDAMFDGAREVDRMQLESLWEAAVWLSKRQRKAAWFLWARSAYRRAELPEPPTPPGVPVDTDLPPR